MTAAHRIVQRLEQLAECTDDPPRLTRLAHSPAMRWAHEVVGVWMHEAGLEVRVDAIGNLIGRRESVPARGMTLLLGSHLDTVRDAGRFDGALGVLLAIACAEALRDRKLPFAIEVLGFIDEEGVRFQSTYLGSRALAGSLRESDLGMRDAAGVTLEEAVREFGGDPAAIIHESREGAKLVGYIEAHIEQGPVLEARDRPLAVVSAIAGQTRARLIFLGEAGHAGTVPISLRHDALCAAAEFILAAEAVASSGDSLLATVGEVGVSPGASNVIPGRVELTVDIRHPNDAVRTTAVRELERRAEAIAARRGLGLTWQIVHSTNAVACDERLTNLLTDAIGTDALILSSGAGHDAAALAALCPVAMLFIRCRRGVSHHPDEFASEEDIAAALEAMLRFIKRLAAEHG